ncbi:MAG: S8 family serine peptidase [Bdellovibrionales bacterium]|nr:S8 family serine peptidase [Bdellovibrionales bacterium]
MKKNGFFLGLVLVFSLSACGRGEPESDGVITLVDDKVEVIRESGLQEEICKKQYCEPNYLLDQSFGLRRRSPPRSSRPLPVPPPFAGPTPKPDPVDPASEVVDVAKQLMNTPEAWGVTEGSPEVIVADIDSGIDLDHPDLKDNLWTNAKEVGSPPGQDRDGNGYANDVHGYDFYAKNGSPVDQNGHGTHTAGTIAAIRNGVGVIGVAPKVKLMALRFIGPQGQGSTADAISAIRYATRMGAKIISASWGGGGYSSFLDQAVQDAQKAGVIFVAAAGNEGKDISRFPTYPANLDGVIAVAATDSYDQLTYFSNYGASAVMIAAPGDQILSTFVGQGYKTLSGTSMATPQVAGAIALALSKNKSLQASAIKSALCSSADPVRNGFGVQCGRINVGRFVRGI